MELKERYIFAFTFVADYLPASYNLLAVYVKQLGPTKN